MEAGAEAGAEMAAEEASTCSPTPTPGTSSRTSRTTPPPRSSSRAPLGGAAARRIRAGGFRISDGFISPLDLVAIGLVTAEEAEQLQPFERPAAAMP